MLSLPSNRNPNWDMIYHGRSMWAAKSGSNTKLGMQLAARHVRWYSYEKQPSKLVEDYVQPYLVIQQPLLCAYQGEVKTHPYTKVCSQQLSLQSHYTKEPWAPLLGPRTVVPQNTIHQKQQQRSRLLILTTWMHPNHHAEWRKPTSKDHIFYSLLMIFEMTGAIPWMVRSCQDYHVYMRYMADPTCLISVGLHLSAVPELCLDSPSSAKTSQLFSGQSLQHPVNLWGSQDKNWKFKYGFSVPILYFYWIGPGDR